MKMTERIREADPAYMLWWGVLVFPIIYLMVRIEHNTRRLESARTGVNPMGFGQWTSKRSDVRRVL